MNADTPDTAVAIPPVAPQTAEPKLSKPAKAQAPKAPKAKSKQAKQATKPAAKAKAKKAKAPAKAKAKKPAKASPKAKAKKNVPQGKFPRNKANPFRAGSAYASIMDAMATKKNGIRRDELTALAMEATGKDVKHASYDLAVILSAKESNNGPRHPSCAEGFWVKRDNDCFTLMVD